MGPILVEAGQGGVTLLAALPWALPAMFGITLPVTFALLLTIEVKEAHTRSHYLVLRQQGEPRWRPIAHCVLTGLALTVLGTTSTHMLGPMGLEHVTERMRELYLNERLTGENPVSVGNGVALAKGHKKDELEEVWWFGQQGEQVCLAAAERFSVERAQNVRVRCEALSITTSEIRFEQGQTKLPSTWARFVPRDESLSSWKLRPERTWRPLAKRAALSLWPLWLALFVPLALGLTSPPSSRRTFAVGLAALSYFPVIRAGEQSGATDQLQATSVFCLVAVYTLVLLIVPLRRHYRLW